MPMRESARANSIRPVLSETESSARSMRRSSFGMRKKVQKLRGAPRKVSRAPYHASASLQSMTGAGLPCPRRRSALGGWFHRREGDCDLGFPDVIAHLELHHDTLPSLRKCGVGAVVPRASARNSGVGLGGTVRRSRSLATMLGSEASGRKFAPAFSCRILNGDKKWPMRPKTSAEQVWSRSRSS